MLIPFREWKVENPCLKLIRLKHRNVHFHATPICLVRFSTWKTWEKSHYYPETLVYQFSEEWIQSEPQGDGTPLPAGDGLHTVGILPSWWETHHPAALGLHRRLERTEETEQERKLQLSVILARAALPHFLRKFSLVVKANILLTVTVLASISVNMNSPPSKSPFRYNSALEREKVK